MESNAIHLIPVGAAQVYHFSQGDNGRQIRCNLYNGMLAVKLTGSETLKLYCQTPDKQLVIVDVANTSSTYVDITIPNTLTAVAGKVYCKLHIDGLGAKAFYLDIEGRP